MLNIYIRITDEIQRNAARNIDQGIAGMKVQEQDKTESATPVEFTPYKPLHHRPGTGCISQINDHLWEECCSPKWIGGKKHARNIYAHTREECEEKLAMLKPAQAVGTLSRH